MRLRDATGLTVAAACSALIGCADASGIVLTVEPEADGPAGIREADTLVVYVGYGDLEEQPLDSAAIRLHIDDGHARELALDAPFTAPIDVLLEGPETGEPFYVAVRALRAGDVVGEGGVDGTLTLVDGKVTVATALVGGPLVRSMPNCPGFRVGNVRHYIVSADRDDDCDADGEPAAQPGPGADCDDFDAAFHPGADDQNCDALDHTCGHNTNELNAACLVEEDGNCWLGTQTCRDGEGGTGECTMEATNPLPQTACQLCEGEPDLEACLTKATDHTAVCAIKREGMKVCLPKVLQGAFASEAVWWHDNGFGGPGNAKWLEFPRVREYDFAWAVAPGLLGDESLSYPGSPVLELVTPAIATTHEFTKFVVGISDGNLALYRIVFSVEDNVCPPDPDEEPDCFGFPPPDL